MKLIIVYFFCLISYQILGQNNQQNKTAELDSSILSGKLANGFTYYVKDLPNSDSPLELRLYVRAGRNQQTEGQLNFAHFVEHMAFKSTRHFPNGITNHLGNSLEEGMDIFDVSGHSGATHMEYVFSAPSGNRVALDTGLQWFRDIADGLSLKTEEINSERGVLIQENIIRNGDNFQKTYNQNQLELKLFPCNQDKTNFFDHHKSFDPDSLRGFYKKWYQPESMVLLVVGKVANTDSLIQKIRSNFSSIKSENKELKWVNCDSLFFNRDPQFAIMEKNMDSLGIDNEVRIELQYRDPASSLGYHTPQDIWRDRKISLFLNILNTRFREKTEKYNIPYTIVADHTNRVGADPSTLQIHISASQDREMDALKEAISSISQISKKGSSEGEFERAKREQLEYLNTKETGKSRYWIQGIKKYFINGIPFPQDKITMEKNWLKEYSLEEFNKFLKDGDLNMPEDIAFLAPKNHKALSYSENAIRAYIERIFDDTDGLYEPPEVPEYLLNRKEIETLKEKEYKEVHSSVPEVKEFMLKNGVRVILKSFDPAPGVLQDKIYIHGFKPKGAFNVDPDDYFSAINAPDIIKNGGVGRLDKFEFQRFLSGNSLWWYGIKPYIKNLESGIEIDSDAEDLEIALQVIYLLLSKPVLNEAAFKDWKSREIELYKNQNIDLKDTDLNTSIKQIIDDNSGVLRGTARFSGLDQVNLKRANSIYQQLLGSSDGFQFIITGKFSISKNFPLINKYLGNIPLGEKSFSKEWSNSYREALPAGPVYSEFVIPENIQKRNMMYKPQHIIFSKKYNDWKEHLRVQALGSVVNNQAWGLRFNKDYSLYVAGASGTFNPESNQYVIGASFDCIPDQFPLLRKEYEKIISNLKSELISEEKLFQSLERLKFLNDPQRRGGSNRSINKKLHQHYRFNIPYVNNHKTLEFINSITPNDIRSTARKYFKKENYYEFLMKN